MWISHVRDVMLVLSAEYVELTSLPSKNSLLLCLPYGCRHTDTHPQYKLGKLVLSWLIVVHTKHDLEVVGKLSTNAVPPRNQQSTFVQMVPLCYLRTTSA